MDSTGLQLTVNEELVDSPVLVLAEGGGGRWGEEYDVSNERGADGDGGSMHEYEEADEEGADCKEKSNRA